MIKSDELKAMKYFIKMALIIIDTRRVSEYLQIPNKRLMYILSKWVNKGYIEYGTSLNFVWVTVKGLKYFKECGSKVDE